MAEKLAAKARIFPSRPVLGTFLVMFAIINVSYFAYGSWFAVIKASGAATSVACPWPYPEAKVYDPQGLYEKPAARPVLGRHLVDLDERPAERAAARASRPARPGRRAPSKNG